MTKLRDRTDDCCPAWKRMVSDAKPGACLPTFDDEGFMQGCDAWWSSNGGGEQGPNIIPIVFCPWCGVNRVAVFEEQQRQDDDKCLEKMLTVLPDCLEQSRIR